MKDSCPFFDVSPLGLVFIFFLLLLLLLLSTLCNFFFFFFFLFFVIWKWIGGFLLISYSASSLCINGAGLGMYKGRGWRGLKYNGYRFESYFLLYEIRKFLENVIFFIAAAFSALCDPRTNRRIRRLFRIRLFLLCTGSRNVLLRTTGKKYSKFSRNLQGKIRNFSNNLCVRFLSIKILIYKERYERKGWRRLRCSAYRFQIGKLFQWNDICCYIVFHCILLYFASLFIFVFLSYINKQIQSV